ncbi:hypothetical protein E2C01_043572 [Portunus trituberculatus]|uniref:Uncharacterized protein n=1 Tax=Portunus trituberculatus TaxID=210409 RepID=A0A5B7FX24_PORTR|nr:hypothetical protein [Portunus trituberculatus]
MGRGGARRINVTHAFATYPWVLAWAGLGREKVRPAGTAGKRRTLIHLVIREAELTDSEQWWRGGGMRECLSESVTHPASTTDAEVLGWLAHSGRLACGTVLAGTGLAGYAGRTILI